MGVEGISYTSNEDIEKMDMPMQPSGPLNPPPYIPPTNGYPVMAAQPAPYPPAVPGHPPGACPRFAPSVYAPNNVTNNHSTNNNNSSNVNTTVVVGQPGASGNSLLLLPKEKWNVRGWQSGVCSCLNDIHSLACGCICPCYLWARNANRMNECCLMPCVPGAMTAMRTKVRTMGGIKGSITWDCFITHFFPCCAACQLAREMDAMGL